MTTNIQFARQVAKHVQLKAITLRRAQVESFLAPELALQGEISITQQHRCTYQEKTGQGEREIHVLAEFKLRASKDDDDDGNLVTLDAAFVLVYGLPESVTLEPKCIQHFAELNGAYNAWPYWREIVQTTTGRVGLAGIVIPVFRPIATKVAEEEEAATPD